MKKNALSCTLLLFPVSLSQDLFHTVDTAHKVVPQLTRGGVRSMLHLLVKNGVLAGESVNGESRYYLTSTGKNELVAQFPALDASWDTYQGEWQCIVFQNAPKSDLQFRYLRTQVVKENALQLSRGVYCIPGCFSLELLSICRRLYAQSVTIFSAASWDLGFERSTVTQNYALADIATAYSGIGREIGSLLNKKHQEDNTTDQLKTAFSSVYARFRDVLLEDRGVVRHYYPSAVTARQLLQQLQEFFF